MFTKNNGLIVKIIAAVLVIAMIVVVAVIGSGAAKDAQAAADAAQNTANEAVNGLTDLTDKMEKLEGAIADLTDKITNAEKPEVIDPAKWAEATANIPAANKALDEAIAAIAVEYGFVADEEGNKADVWYADYEIAAAAEAAKAVAVDAIARATSVEAQEAAIEAVKAALAPENFEKIDAKIAGLIAEVEADGVTYADKEYFDYPVIEIKKVAGVETVTVTKKDGKLAAALDAATRCCADAKKAVADAKYQTKYDNELLKAFKKDAIAVLTADYKAAMDAYSAKVVTVAILEDEANVTAVEAELKFYAGDAGFADIQSKTKIANSITKFNNKKTEVATLKEFVEKVTNVKDEDVATSYDGFNAEMANFLKDIEKKTLKEIYDEIKARDAKINGWVEGTDADVATKYVDLLDNEENYNIIDHATLDAIKANFEAKTAAIVEKADAFVDAVVALEKATEEDGVDLTVVTLVETAKKAWDALKADYTYVTKNTIELFKDEDGVCIYEKTIDEYKASYDAKKATFATLTEYVKDINDSYDAVNKLVFVDYQGGEKDDKGNFVDQNKYTITNVDKDTFVKVFCDTTKKYQDAETVLTACKKSVEDAYDALVETYELELDAELLAKVEAVQLLAEKFAGVKAVLEAREACTDFVGADVTAAELIDDIWNETDRDVLAVTVASIATLLPAPSNP